MVATKPDQRTIASPRLERRKRLAREMKRLAVALTNEAEAVRIGDLRINDAQHIVERVSEVLLGAREHRDARALLQRVRGDAAGLGSGECNEDLAKRSQLACDLQEREYPASPRLDRMLYAKTITAFSERHGQWELFAKLAEPYLGDKSGEQVRQMSKRWRGIRSGASSTHPQG